ncbi:MAG: glycoside hydrolase family 3 C-terminal domain-containing protein [Terriglobales bacterium]
MRIIRTALIALALVQSAIAQTTAPSPPDVTKRVESILGRMTLEEKISYIGGTNTFFIRAIPRLGIPALKMSDGPLGVHDYGQTTAYAAPIALAASWDARLAHDVGAMMGDDARARGVHFILAPGMNIYRAPMCGRNFEYLGEDPFLASRMAVSLIDGIQSRRVIATAKHFVANNQEYDRYDVSSDIDERTLREIYLPTFEASVKEAHVGALMDSYNLVNGVHMTQNDYLNNRVLKKEWGFNGILMSDWGSTHDGVAAANGGLDLEMPDGGFMNAKTLLPAIREGKVTVATIDDKVRRILRTAIEFGFFDRPQADASIPVYSQPGRQLALQEAREGMVLLKNEAALLPLDKSKTTTIAVFGPDAFAAVPGGGGSSETKPFNAVSFLEGISNYLGEKGKVLYAIDIPPLEEIFKNSEFVTSPGGEPGLQGEYFNNQDLEGTPALVRTDQQVDFKWGDGSYIDGGPTDHFSVRWSGFFVPKSSGEYKFYVSADDGVRLYLDDQRVIDDWQRHAETLDSFVRELEGGHPYRVRLEYFEAVGTATAGFGVVAARQSIGKEVKALAANAGAAIVCVGFNPSSETEGSDRTFRLPAGQDELIREIASINKNTIVVITSGGAVDMTGWVGAVPAVIEAWYPGEEGGTALAQILFGDYSPSGKLPASFERRWEDNATFNSYYPKNGSKRVEYSEGVFLGYRHFDRSSVKPLFPFGYGLSYTRFTYSNLSISPASGDLAEPLHVSFDVHNTGKREGAEVAEVYVSEDHASVPRPVKELKGFARADLKPGETEHVELTLDRRAFAFYDTKSKGWKAEPGAFKVLVGGSSDKIELQGAYSLLH